MVKEGVAVGLEEVQFAGQQVNGEERGGEVDVWLKGLVEAAVRAEAATQAAVLAQKAQKRSTCWCC